MPNKIDPKKIIGFSLHPVGRREQLRCSEHVWSSNWCKHFKTVECLGACGYAPMMQMGKHYREHLTKEKIDAIIDECRKNAAANN